MNTYMMDSIAGSLSTSALSMSTKLPPVKKVDVQIDASHRAATIEIKSRNVEMDADWDKVREEFGYLKLYGQIREITSMGQRSAVEAIQSHVGEGLRLRNIHSDRGNVFGSIAYNKYMESRKKEVELVALPKYGVHIDVKIYPIEIRVETHGKGVSSSL